MQQIAVTGKLPSLHPSSTREKKTTASIFAGLSLMCQDKNTYSQTYSKRGVLELESAHPCFVNLKMFFLWLVQTQRPLFPERSDLILLD